MESRYVQKNMAARRMIFNGYSMLAKILQASTFSWLFVFYYNEFTLFKYRYADYFEQRLLIVYFD